MGFPKWLGRFGLLPNYKNLDHNDEVIYDQRTFIEKLLNCFNGNLTSFTNRRYLNQNVFKDHAMVVVKDAKEKEKEDPVDGVQYILAKVDLLKDTYTTHDDVDRAMN